MSDFLNRMKSAAKADLKTIVLPEGEDPRTIVAANKIIEEGLANIVILGDPNEINVPGATVIDPRNAEKHEEYAQKFAELRAKKAALQKALAEAIEACTGTKVDPASLTLTDEDVSFPKENISANKDVLNRTYVYTASDGKKYTFTYNFVYNDKPSSVSGAGYKGAGYFMDGIHVGTEEIVADADGKTDHKSTLIESGVFVSGNATTDANLSLIHI